MPTVEITQGPPGSPTITDDIESISVFLRTPPYVQRRMESLLTQRFLTPQIFSRGPNATGGAVVYDQVTANDLFLGRDVQNIVPGAEIPLLTEAKPTPKVAAVDKYGGRVKISQEAVDRNDYGRLNRALTQLENTIVKKVDTQGMAVLNAAPLLTYAFPATFAAATTSFQIIDYLLAAKLLGVQTEMPYTYGTLLLNPKQALRMQGLGIKDKLLGEQAQENIVRGSTIGRILDFDIYMSNYVPDGTGYWIDRNQIGAISDEVPLATASYYREEYESWFVQGTRRFVPYVTDPLAGIKMTGL